MGLTWKPTHLTRRRTGYDVEGLEYAFAQRRSSGEWDVYVRPIGCGEERGMWFNGAWPTADEAMEFADRLVVAYVDCCDADDRAGKARGGTTLSGMADEKLWTAAEMEQLTPNQRAELVRSRTVTDLSTADPALVEWARREGRRLLEERGVLTHDES